MRVPDKNAHQKSHTSPEQYQDKVFSVEHSNTVLRPNAVMVHIVNAAFTFGTVVRPFRLNYVAEVTFPRMSPLFVLGFFSLSDLPLLSCVVQIACFVVL